MKPPTVRSADFIVDWQCMECEYTEEAIGGMGPRTCPKCGKDTFYVTFTATCPQHGSFQSWWNYDADGKPSMVKVADGPWVPRLDGNRSGLRCPVCDRSMMPSGTSKRPQQDDNE